MRCFLNLLCAGQICQFRHKIELSKYIWNLKDNKRDFKIKWETLNRTRSKFKTKYGCKICNLEKKEIEKSEKNIILNKKSERQNFAYTTKNNFIAYLFHLNLK